MEQQVLTTTSQVLTTAQATKRLDITPMAFYLWRQGSTVREPLPVMVLKQFGQSPGRHRVVIYMSDLKDYLSKYRPDLLERLVDGQ